MKHKTDAGKRNRMFDDQLKELDKGEARISTVLCRLVEIPAMNEDDVVGLRNEFKAMLASAEKLDDVIATVDIPPSELALYSAIGALLISMLKIRKDMRKVMGMLLESLSDESDVPGALIAYTEFISKLVHVGESSSAIDLNSASTKAWVTGIRKAGERDKIDWSKALDKNGGDIAAALLEEALRVMTKGIPELDIKPDQQCADCDSRQVCAANNRPIEACDNKTRPSGWEKASGDVDAQKLKS